MGTMYRRLPADGDVEAFEPTDYTRSNWSPEIQHGSPPLALLTKSIEGLLDGSDLRIGRLSLEILGAIPVVPVAVSARIERPGKRISLLAAEMTPLEPATARPVARVTAWALAKNDTSDVASNRYPPLLEGETVPLEKGWWNVGGYVPGIEWRRQHTDPADAAVFWLSPKVNLVDDEETTGTQRLAMVVDSANGVGTVLDSTFAYMNTDTVVHLHRLPTGCDFGVRARASIGPDGIGVTNAEIFDRTGFVGTSAQTLLIQRL
jgi:hypothetical protein